MGTSIPRKKFLPGLNVLLTSCGLETPAITDCFLRMLPKAPEAVRAIFISTAANSSDAIEVLPKCLRDLLKCGTGRRTSGCMTCTGPWARKTAPNTM